ncbi:hypothetical protein ScalyP_jg11427 [Parmales sp. scaly parma]|nr:hypothetical protein ScalyP_jg11427 [Parmales sp. scaly parma]
MAGAPDLTAVMAQLVKQQQDAEQQRAEFKIVLAQLLQAKDTSKQRDSLTLQSSTTDSVSRADFNRVLDELTRDREEARKDSREQLAQAHQRELENKEREKEFLEASLKRELERDADNKEREKEILEVSLKRELEREMMIRDESRQRDVDNKEREKIIREEAREQRQEMANLYQMMLQTQQNENQTQIQTQMIQMPVQTNSQRDSKYGLVFRVAVGALLSTIDATTDLYTLYTYWTSGFRGQAMVLLAMIASNLGIQILVNLAIYKNKTTTNPTSYTSTESSTRIPIC